MQNPFKAKGAPMITKPESCFSLQLHAFTVRGRKASKGNDVPKKEWALFMDGKVLDIPVRNPIKGIPDMVKYVRESHLKQMASLLNEGYSEEILSAVISQTGNKELIKILQDRKIKVLDFCEWSKDALAGIKKIPKASAKSKTASFNKEALQLASILQPFTAHRSPQVALDAVKKMLLEQGDAAVGILDIYLRTNGRNTLGTIRFRREKAKK